MARTPSRLDAVAVLALAPTLAALSPHPCDAVRALSATADPTAPLLAAVALAAWTCTAWLALVLTVGVGGRLPGAAGGTARALLRRLAPASVRTLVCAATGLTVAGSVLLGPAASAAERVPAPPSVSLDWPTAASPTAPALSAPALSPARPTPAPLAARPTASPSRSPSPSPSPRKAPPPAAGTAAVTVRPGDSLWALAARDLGPRATGAQVAQAWPTWWSANRTVIGDDPDLILPGTSLTRPHTDPTR